MLDLNSINVGNNTIDYLLRKAEQTDEGLTFLGRMAPHYYSLAKKWFRSNGATFENERSCVLRRDDGAFSLKYLEDIKKIEFKYCARVDDMPSLPVAVPSPLPIQESAPDVETTPDLNTTPLNTTLGHASAMQQNLSAILRLVKAVSPGNKPFTRRDEYLSIETRPLPGDNTRYALYFTAPNGDEDFIECQADKSFKALIHWQTWSQLIPLLSPERIDIEFTKQERLFCDEAPRWGVGGKYHTEERFTVILRQPGNITRLPCPDESKLIEGTNKTVVSAKSKELPDYNWLAKAAPNTEYSERNPAQSWGYIEQINGTRCAWVTDGYRAHIVAAPDDYTESTIQFKNSYDKPVMEYSKAILRVADKSYNHKFTINSNELRFGAGVQSLFWVLLPDGKVYLAGHDVETGDMYKLIRHTNHEPMPAKAVVIGMNAKHLRDALPAKSKNGVDMLVEVDPESGISIQYSNRWVLSMPMVPTGNEPPAIVNQIINGQI